MKRIFVLLILFVGSFWVSAQDTIVINRGLATCDIVPLYETPRLRVTGNPMCQMLFNADSLTDMAGKHIISFRLFTGKQSTGKARQAAVRISVREIRRGGLWGIATCNNIIFNGMVNSNGKFVDVPLSVPYKYKGKNLIIQFEILFSDRIVCRGATTTTRGTTLLWANGAWTRVSFSPQIEFIYK